MVPMSRSPSQAPESLPGETTPPSAQNRGSAPTERRKDTEGTITRVMTPDPTPVVAPLDANEDTRSISSDTQINNKGDRATIGDWVGTWWGKKPKGRSVASFPSAETVTDSATATDQESIRSVETDEQSVGSSSTGVDRKPKRKPTKSVFGTLGLSMLNPSLSGSFSTRKRRTISQLITPGEIAAVTAGVTTPSTETFTPASTSTEPMDSQSVSTLDVQIASEPIPKQGSSIRAIVNATRVMTNDPASILVDQGRDASPLIRTLALELIRNARDKKLDIRELPKPRTHRAVTRRTTTLSPVNTDIDDDPITTPTIQRHNNSTRSRETESRTFLGTVDFSALASPVFGSFLPDSRKQPAPGGETTKKAGTLDSTSSSTQPQGMKPGSVALESIIPANAQPPTHYLARTYTPLTARDFHFTLPISEAPALLLATDEPREVFTDRYGFIYDVSLYDFLLLLRAKSCENTAPACLTGIKVADRREDNVWPEDEDEESARRAVEIVTGPCDCDSADSVDNISINTTNSRLPSRDAAAGDTTSLRSRDASPTPGRGRPRSSTTTPGQRPDAAKLRSMSGSSVLTVGSDTPRHVCATTIKHLLSELRAIHDRRQTRKDWDVFVNQRAKSSAKSGSGPGSRATGVAGGAASMLGLGTSLDEEELTHSDGLIGFTQLGLPSNRDRRREFDRLVRSGIPMVYRSKVWFECSGALDMREPGVFADLLASIDESNSVVREIEKDVGRTMPLNVFFGRTGAGVDKLRRVLRAYSRSVFCACRKHCKLLTRLD